MRDMATLAIGRELETAPNKVYICISAQPQGGDLSGTRVTVVVEVKGSWNPKVRTVVTHQLVDKYLHRGGYRHGIYAVGWYLCDAWSQGRRKRNRLEATTLEDARKEITSLASAASGSEFRVVGVVVDCHLNGKVRRT
jgi:hypothetical protein